MEMSVREARAQFAHAIAAAERGERVTITKNGKPVAELVPPQAEAKRRNPFSWERMMEVRREMGFDKLPPDPRSAEEWLKEFDDPALIREAFGPDYFENESASER